MKENPIKLNQIVTQKQMRDKRKGSLHALNNSFKRNTLMSCDSAAKYESSYECKLPQVNFSRRDLSIILRYLLFKQEMQPADRNLLRRILLSIFQEQLITAGSKYFVNYLKLVQGSREYVVAGEDERQFYFVLKGKGVVTSGQFNYFIKQGNTFGHVEILSNQAIDKVEFQSKFLLLKLPEKYFNEFFRNHYQKIYKEKQAQLICVKQHFLDKIPLLNKYLFCDRLQYKTFSAGEKIVLEGDPLKKLYFLNNSTNTDISSNKCIGLSQFLRQKETSRQSVYCTKKCVIPYVDPQVFHQYILNYCNQSFIMNQSSAFQKFNMNTRASFQTPQVIRNFMNVKIVRLKFNRSRLKTEPSEFYQTSFKFFKPDRNRTSINPEKMKQKETRPSTKTRYQRFKDNLTLTKSLKNNYF